MPIRNPFTRRPGVVTNDENLRPQSPHAPGFERVDTVGSKASSVLSIRSARSQDTGEYKMSVVNDSGVYLPVSAQDLASRSLLKADYNTKSRRLQRKSRSGRASTSHATQSIPEVALATSSTSPYHESLLIPTGDLLLVLLHPDILHLVDERRLILKNRIYQHDHQSVLLIAQAGGVLTLPGFLDFPDQLSTIERKGRLPPPRKPLKTSAWTTRSSTSYSPPSIGSVASSPNSRTVKTRTIRARQYHGFFQAVSVDKAAKDLNWEPWRIPRSW